MSESPPSRPQPPHMLRAMLLDLDGTVADTHGLIVQCYDFAIRAHLGREGIREIWRQRVGLPLDDILLATYAHYEAPIDAELLETVKQTYRAHMREHLDTVTAFPTMRETLVALKARGLRLAIVTTKHRAMALKHLETLDFTSLFDAVVGGDECAHCKPHPEPFLKALERLGVAAEDAVAVGDSRQDILGAKAAGVYAIAALWGSDNQPALFDAEPDRIANVPPELLEIAPAAALNSRS